MNIYHLLDFRKKEKLEKTLKIGNKGNRNPNFIFWNFKDQKNGKIGEEGGGWGRCGYLGIFFIKINLLEFKEIDKIGKKIIFWNLENQKDGKIGGK